MGRRSRVVIGLFFLIFGQIQGQEEKPPQTVVFYGAVTDMNDLNIVVMAQDMFYTQLQSLNTYTVLDRRDRVYSNQDSDFAENKDAILFYAEIAQTDDGWVCTLHAKLPDSNQEAVNTKYYDSYYRVLTDAKTSLAAVFQSLDALGEGQPMEAPPGREEENVPVFAAVPSLAALGGNWRGEPYADRIVILREGGRGFVIYKTGAAMNVSLKIVDDAVAVTQESKSNASFFPDLAREVALVVAQTAPPIQWIFRMDSQGNLVGTKKTVQALAQAGGQSQQNIEIPALWTRD
jgi:hypothetical protein